MKDGGRNIVIRLIKSLLLVSVIFVVIVFLGSINISDIVDLWVFILISFVILIITYAIKGIRFYFICRSFSLSIGFMRAFLIRISSEFFSLIGVSYVGDEAFRIYVLNRGYDVDVGNATAMGYLEVMSEVLVSVSIVLGGLLYIIFYLSISSFIMYLLLVVSLVTIVFHLMLVFKTNLIGGYLIRLIKVFSPLIGTDRVDSLIESLYNFLSTFGRSINISIKQKNLILPLIVLTFITSFLGGLSLWILAYPLGINLDIWLSIIVLHMSLILSSLPITISGSGIFELVILLAGGAFSNNIPWVLPVSFRISSYYLPLFFTFIPLTLFFDDFLENKYR